MLFSVVSTARFGRAAPSEQPLPTDPTLATLIAQSVDARPELTQAKALVRASEQRVPQARALPDPMLQVGIQNDGFKSIEIGRMETSYVSLMASQTFPWPGKLRQRGRIAELDTEDAKNAVTRVRLSTEAEVRRAYVDLIWARDRLALLADLEAIWQKAQSLTRTLYQTGAASQSDMLRADLELQRLKQRRVALEAQQRLSVQALNRLRNHPLDEPIPTSSHLLDTPLLESFRSAFSAEAALARSPELKSARLAVDRAGKASSLAERSYYPDLTVGAGFMYRGALPPMWQVTLGGPLPLYSGSKQSRAVAESNERARAAQAEVEALAQLIRLRSSERAAAFSAELATLGVYEQGLLVQSQTTAESTLVQYTTGKVSFASVLEANAGYLADEEGYLQSIADAQRILIAEQEVSLAETPIVNGGGGGSSMPATGAASMGSPGQSKNVDANPSSSSGSAPSGSSGM